jgi:hypothetical protein
VVRSDAEAASRVVWVDGSGCECLGTSDDGYGGAVIQRGTMSTEYFRRDGGYFR